MKIEPANSRYERGTSRGQVITILKSGLSARTDIESHAQLYQDLFALAFNGFKDGGFFVEFGATNGVSLSNTFVLEKCFNWTGVLAEPERKWQGDLKRNRKCLVDNRCVWKETGKQLSFSSADVGELSTLTEFANSDSNASKRKNADTYPVQTVSLQDLLKLANAPKVIDYLSVDTEGSELEILNAFNFGEYVFNFVTIEHNYTKHRKPLISLMERNGYRQVFRSLSRFDAWFVPA